MRRGSSQHGQRPSISRSCCRHDPPASLPPIPGEVDLQEVLRKVWRRKSLIVGVTIGLTVIAALIIFQITPLYTAHRWSLINDRHTQVVDVEAVVSRLAEDPETIESETEVIKSRGIAAKTVDRLRLQEIQNSMAPLDLRIS